MNKYNPDDECVQCESESRGKYLGHPCCMRFDCIEEIEWMEEVAEQTARIIFGKWIKYEIRKNVKRKKT